MANTKIQIKRSLVTDAPGSLDAGELGYSYSANTLYIGTGDGAGVIAIGGSTITDAASDYANAVAAAANSWANTVGASGNAYTNVVGAAGNAYANVVGASGNAYADVVGASSNNYANATFVKLSSATTQTISSDIAITGNLTIAGETTYANSQTLLIGDNLVVLNADIPSGVAPVENAGVEVNRGSKNANASLIFIETTEKWAFTSNNLQNITTYIASNTDVESVALSANNYAGAMANAANAYAVSVGASGNAYADVVGASGNAYANLVGTSANAYAASVGASGNAYADVVGGAANTNAANGSYISTGIVKVPYGGTGVTSFTENGIVFGNTAGDLKVTAAGIEGQVLQASAIGVPQFGMLDGGSF